MSFDPFGITFAFTAGALALFSPCGFPMLPGYISYYMGTEASLRRAVTNGFACSLGLLAIFGLIGGVASLLGGIVSQYIHILELAAGLTTMVLGLGVLAGVKISVFLPFLKAPRQRSLLGVFLYGALYGLATLGCSAPIFFSILFYAVTAGGPIYGVATFMVYALGMGLPLFVTTILVAKAKELMLKRMMNAAPTLQKLSGILLITIGAYLVIYYFTVLRAT